VDDREFLTLVIVEHLRTCLKPIAKSPKLMETIWVGTSGDVYWKIYYNIRMIVGKYPTDTDRIMGFPPSSWIMTITLYSR
jgi:hypothetical protein